MTEPCEFPSLHSFQKQFLKAHKEVGLAPQLVTGLVLQVGDVRKLPQALGLESLVPFLIANMVKGV